MNNVSIKDLREQLTSQDIVEILGRLNVQPVNETSQAIIFPTCCHNAVGGSPKLYYYKDNKFFHCYTECQTNFDIFDLIVKVQKLHGIEFSLYDAIKFCNLSVDAPIETEGSVQEDINYLYNLLFATTGKAELPKLDEKILSRFIFDKDALQVWANEDISFETMRKYHILYDSVDNCIVIPNYDINGNLISLRGRFMDIDSPVKYRPLYYNQQLLSHPSSLNLYGLNINKDAIAQNQKAIIFEAEKSVMKMDTYFDTNISVATLGKNISMQQIELLLGLGAKEIILAYDADYRNRIERDKKIEEYTTIAKSLKTYFNVAVLIDFYHDLKYKDSPIDRGPAIFKKILKNRIYV